MQWKLFFMTYFDRHFTYLISVNYTCDHPLSVYVCYKGCLIVVSMSAVYMCMYVAIGVLLLFQCLLSICYVCCNGCLIIVSMCCLYVYVCYNRCLIIVSMSAIYMCMYVTMGVLLLVQCMLSICVCMLQWVSYYCFNVFCLYVIYMFK